MKKIPTRQPRQIKQEELAKIRKFFHRKQHNICPILKMKFKEEDMVCDHAHSANARNLGRSFEAGLLRGVINRQANTMDGKITNAYIRCGLHKTDVTLPDFLRGLADFIEFPPMIKLKYIHPGEKAKAPILKKNPVKKVRQLYIARYPNKKIPEVLIYKKKKDKRGKLKEVGKKLTVGLERLFIEFNITPEFKKGK